MLSFESDESGEEYMFNFDPRRQMFILAILLSIVLAAAMIYYFLFTGPNERVPTRGIFVHIGRQI